MNMIPTVEALDMPEEVEDWCDENNIVTHGEHSIVSVDDDGNPFSEWLKEQGFKFDKGPKELKWAWVGIFSS